FVEADVEGTVRETEEQVEDPETTRRQQQDLRQRKRRPPGGRRPWIRLVRLLRALGRESARCAAREGHPCSPVVSSWKGVVARGMSRPCRRSHLPKSSTCVLIARFRCPVPFYTGRFTHRTGPGTTRPTPVCWKVVIGRWLVTAPCTARAQARRSRWGSCPPSPRRPPAPPSSPARFRTNRRRSRPRGPSSCPRAR